MLSLYLKSQLGNIVFLLLLFVKLRKHHIVPIPTLNLSSHCETCMVVQIKRRIYSRDLKISTSTMKRNLCVESWRKSGNWPRSKIRQTETRSDIATLLRVRAGAESPALCLILTLK
jgi:hypothetical protein